MPIFVLLSVMLFSHAVSAQQIDYQTNWSPNRYKLECFLPFSCIYGDEVHDMTEELMPQVIDGIRGLNFDPPLWFGKRVSPDDAEHYMELEEGRFDDAPARARPRCPRLGNDYSSIEIGSQFTLFNDRDYLIYYFLAHEFFHVIQYDRPFYDLDSCNNLPGWIKEGMATAVGQATTRSKFPDVFPESSDERVARNFAGLRRYDKPLNLREFEEGKEVKTGADIYYRTSSFWRHLAEAHYQGQYDFLDDYMMQTNTGESWIPWLRRNLKKGTGDELGMVFAGFLADYAGWGDEGFPGQFYQRRKWLYETLTGCEVVEIDRTDAVGFVELELSPLSGKCVEVHVPIQGSDGIREDESAAVQIAAIIMSGPPTARDGIHLGLAASNDRQQFHCATEVRQYGKQGLAKCVFTPDDGEIHVGGGTVDARVWNVFAQEKGDPEEMRQEAGEREVELTNIYTVSYTPTQISMRDKNYNNSAPVTVQVYFILDVAALEMEGDKQGAVGTFGAGGADPQTTLPKRDKSGKRVNSFSKPDQFQPSLPTSANMTRPAQTEGKLGNIFIYTGAENAGPDNSSIMLIPGAEIGQGEIEAYALGVGETGSFPSFAMASINGEPAVGVGAIPLIVEEFTDLVFRAHFSGTLCRHRDLTAARPGETIQNPCLNPFQASGEIVKAFAGSRLPGREMVVERTAGTEIYREANERGMAQWSTTTEPGVEKPGGQPPAPGGSGSGGGTLADCNCTCEERSATLQRAEELKAHEQAGGKVAPAEIMGLMRCESACRSEYLACVIEEDEERKAREKEEAVQAERELVNPGECDCSCAALNELQGRSEELLREFQAGSISAMEEMQKLGTCVSACQEQVMSCAQSR